MLQASAAEDEEEVSLALVDDTDKTVVEEVLDDIAPLEDALEGALEDTLEDESVEVAKVYGIVSLISSIRHIGELGPDDQLSDGLHLKSKQERTPKTRKTKLKMKWSENRQHTLYQFSISIGLTVVVITARLEAELELELSEEEEEEAEEEEEEEEEPEELADEMDDDRLELLEEACPELLLSPIRRCRRTQRYWGSLPMRRQC